MTHREEQRPTTDPDAEASPERLEDRLSIKVLRAADLLFLRCYHSLTVLAPSPLPRAGGGILVCNHVSSLDPALVQAACPRRVVTWMMAKEYMDVRGMGWFFRAMGVIPVDRNGKDTASLRAALRSLKQGQILGVFPEGRIATSRDLLPFHTGAALMALKAGVPVYPAYQDGTHRGKDMLHACTEPARAAIAFGPPLDFTTGRRRPSIEAAAAQIVAAVRALRPTVHAALRPPR